MVRKTSASRSASIVSAGTRLAFSVARARDSISERSLRTRPRISANCGRVAALLLATWSVASICMTLFSLNCLGSRALHRELAQYFDFRLERRHSNRIGRQARVLSIDINQRIDLAV